VVTAAGDRGLAIDPPAPYRISNPGRPGLIFGYAALDERDLTLGVELLSDAIADVRSGSRSTPDSAARLPDPPGVH
jgi:GntR family transcriptional regulator / MocR family aminotransferase